MKRIILLTLLLSGCSSTYSKQEIDAKLGGMAKAVDKNFQSQSDKIQVLIERVYAKEMAKGRANKCPEAFNFTTGDCIEAKK